VVCGARDMMICFYYELTSVVNIGSSLNHETRSIPQPAKDNLGSLYDLLSAFAFNKAEKANS
jgi:hypothetical protein